MTDPASDILDAAAAWHLAIPTMDGGRWHEFIDWLEADPAHAAAYDAVTQADHRLVGLAPQPRIDGQGLADRPGEPALSLNGTAPPVSRLRAIGAYPRRWAIGGAIAACLVGLVFIATPRGRDQTYEVATRPGFTRTVAMGEGSQLVANGGTRLRLDRADPRRVDLEEGEALFSVRHDATKSFTVTVGKFRIVDMGTVFNVLRDERRLSVAVSEGSVIFESGGTQVLLRAGESLTVDEARGLIMRGKADAVGAWRTGDLQFHGESLAEVTSAIYRRTGTRIKLSDALSDVPFIGNIKLTGESERDAAHLAALVGADLQRDGENWILSPTPAGP